MKIWKILLCLLLQFRVTAEQGSESKRIYFWVPDRARIANDHVKVVLDRKW